MVTKLSHKSVMLFVQFFQATLHLCLHRSTTSSWVFIIILPYYLVIEGIHQHLRWRFTDNSAALLSSIHQEEHTLNVQWGSSNMGRRISPHHMVRAARRLRMIHDGRNRWLHTVASRQLYIQPIGPLDERRLNLAQWETGFQARHGRNLHQAAWWKDRTMLLEFGWGIVDALWKFIQLLGHGQVDYRALWQGDITSLRAALLESLSFSLRRWRRRRL